MDAVVFWAASAGLGAGGYLDIGRQCGRIDAAVVANRPERVLDVGAVCRLVGVCNVLERGSGLVEWLEDMMPICRGVWIIGDLLYLILSPVRTGLAWSSTSRTDGVGRLPVSCI